VKGMTQAVNIFVPSWAIFVYIGQL